jgi:hypothetical protein
MLEPVVFWMLVILGYFFLQTVLKKFNERKNQVSKIIAPDPHKVDELYKNMAEEGYECCMFVNEKGEIAFVGEGKIEPH